MKNTQISPYQNESKIQRNIVETGKMGTPYIQIQAHLPSWLGTCTKKGRGETSVMG